MRVTDTLLSIRLDLYPYPGYLPAEELNREESLLCPPLKIHTGFPYATLHFSEKWDKEMKSSLLMSLLLCLHSCSR